MDLSTRLRVLALACVCLAAALSTATASTLSAYRIIEAAKGKKQEPYEFMKEARANKSAEEQLHKISPENKSENTADAPKLIYLVSHHDRVPQGLSGLVGYFLSKDFNAVYQFTLDVRTNDLEDPFLCIYNVNCDEFSNLAAPGANQWSSEQGLLHSIEASSFGSSLESLNFVGNANALAQFNIVFPKFAEWKEKAEELKLEPFRRLIPKSETNIGSCSTAVNFLWAPARDHSGGPPQAQLEFTETKGGRTSTTLTMDMRQIAAVKGAFVVRSSAKRQLQNIHQELKESATRSKDMIKHHFD